MDGLFLLVNRGLATPVNNQLYGTKSVLRFFQQGHHCGSVRTSRRIRCTYNSLRPFAKARPVDSAAVFQKNPNSLPAMLTGTIKSYNPHKGHLARRGASACLAWAGFFRAFIELRRASQGSSWLFDLQTGESMASHLRRAA